MSEDKQNFCSASRENSSGFLSGLLLGGVAGAAAFFLLGTEKGRKIKEVLIKEGKEFLNEIEDLQENLKEEPKREEIVEEIIREKAIREPQIPLVHESIKEPVKVKKTISQRFFKRNGRKLG